MKYLMPFDWSSAIHAVAATLLTALILLVIFGYARAEQGIASVYSTHDKDQSGTRTASGIPLNDGAFTAAHRSLPFGTRVRVTNRQNGRSLILTITDRGPYVKGRILDVTRAAAKALGFCCLAPITIERQ